jgi:ankyrin repeat protein
MDIKKGNCGDAYHMLQCLTVAIRLLSVAELAELLAFDFDVTNLKGGIPKLNSKWRWEDYEQAVLSTCSSLITIVPADDSLIVQFSHFSVKEFLLSDRLATSTKDISRYHIALEDANTLISRACLSVLLWDPVDDRDVAIAPSPLARYATEHWVVHAKVENVASCISDGMESLFDPDRPYFSVWIKLYNADVYRWPLGSEHKIRPEVAPLYHAAFFGFHKIVENLALKYPQHARAISGGTGTALHSVSFTGHIEVVRSLLKCGVDVDARGFWNMSPLQFALLQGHLDVVQCLLDHDTDVNFQDDELRTPLSLVTVKGHLDIVRVLLEHNADIFTQNKDGLTPFHRVFLIHPVSESNRRPEAIQLLLERGTNPNTQNNQHQTPLHLAASSTLPLSPTLKLARILLAHGADIDSKDSNGKTPLQVALASGETEWLSCYRDIIPSENKCYVTTWKRIQY